MMCPKDIYQAHLDTAGQAFWKVDFSKVLDMIHFPSFIETDDANLHMLTPESYLPSLKSYPAGLIKPFAGLPQINLMNRCTCKNS